MLNIIQINYNTIDTQETDRANNHSTNTALHQGSCHEQHYINMMQEAGRAKKYYANTDSTSKFDNQDKPTVFDEGPYTINISFQVPTKIIIRE